MVSWRDLLKRLTKRQPFIRDEPYIKDGTVLFHCWRPTANVPNYAERAAGDLAFLRRNRLTADDVDHVDQGILPDGSQRSAFLVKRGRGSLGRLIRTGSYE